MVLVTAFLGATVRLVVVAAGLFTAVRVLVFCVFAAALVVAFGLVLVEVCEEAAALGLALIVVPILLLVFCVFTAGLFTTVRDWVRVVTVLLTFVAAGLVVLLL